VPLFRATFLSADLRLSPEEQHALSPVNLQPHSESPLVLAVGALESTSFQEQSQRLALQWRQVVRGAPLSIAGCNHFSVCEDLADPRGQLFITMLQMMLDGRRA